MCRDGEAATRAEEIFLGTDSQTQDIDRLVSAMAQVSQTAEGHCAAIEGVVRTSQRQSTSMTEMAAGSVKLNELADQLEAVVRRFGSRKGEDTP